ncbi:YkgJ family cysteine cluster protein [Pseudomonas fluorescens]|uniref:YkgJ family cysteine cluster protein n=1 Tax=Pseudomonas fluorescens TaxID=294 RepID=UPI00374A90CD
MSGRCELNYSQDIRFDCNGCGRCCENHHVPLTLEESIRWVTDGGQLIILVEGFIEDGLGLEPNQATHLLRRSHSVRSGTLRPRIITTFAAYNPGRCRYLQADNRCGQYDVRPLVCRIYPAEINPSITLVPQAKDCPPEVWNEGPILIHRQSGVSNALEALIERSRQADRADIGRKVAICELLGITVSAVRGNGYTAWLPDSQKWLSAVRRTETGMKVDVEWAFEVSDEQILKTLLEQGAFLGQSADHQGAFIGLA